MKRVHWRALTTAHADGYSYAALNLSSRLRSQNILSLEDSPLSSKKISSICISVEEGIKFINEPTDIDILINNCLPVDYSFDAKYIVGFSYWETTKLPCNWVSLMNKCNELWTTSSWARDVFINSGVTKPVYSFDLGVNTDAFKFADRSSLPYRPFTFIHIGSPSTRKNTQLVVDSFLRLFGNDENYRLIIKSNGPPDARYYINNINCGGLYKRNNIKVIDYYLTDLELADLLANCNCMIYPTRGEGWGMAPFQAIATGLPTICTDQTACTEFAYLSVPLEAEMSNANQFGIYENGEWANPKIDDLCDKILYVVDNYEEVIQRTKAGSEFIHSKYSWDAVVNSYKNRILEIQNERTGEN
jgi:glycosyltransferase involved in cell wall biosynthesis